MSRLHDYKKVLRGALLLLFAVALIGPWTYTLDGVPPVEWDMCHEPYFLLTEDRCASPVSGATMLAWAPQFVAGVVYDFRADPRSLLRGLLLTGLFSLFVLPPATTLLVLIREHSRRLQRFYLVSLIFAALFGSLLPLLFRQTGITVLPRFWGMWLFAAVAWVALASELLIRRHPPEQPQPLPAAGAGPFPDDAAHSSPESGARQRELAHTQLHSS